MSVQTTSDSNPTRTRMTYYECGECGQLGEFAGIEVSPFTRQCPVCEEPTTWELAFADEDQGVSF